ncbi:aldehyde dehydrogenase family protein [Bdellovibrionota bacterium]
MFKNFPYVDFSKEEEQKKISAALDQLEKEYLGKEWPNIFLGKEVKASTQFESTDPNDPSFVIGKFQNFDSNTMDIDALLKGAKAASKRWNDLGIDIRAKVVERAAEIMTERRYLLTACLVREVGKSYIEGYAAVAEAIDFLKWDAQIAREEYVRKLADTPNFAGDFNQRVLVPHGVFLTLDPFNFQIAIGTDHITKPLIMGNSVIASPSDKAALSGRLVFQIFEDAMKEMGVENNGILNYAPGPGGDIATPILSHPDLSGICFTGSTAVLDLIIKKYGMIQRSNGGYLVIAAAETSGVDAMYVHKDADIDAAAKGTAAALCGLSGQKCSALSTLIAHQDIYDQLLEKTKVEIDKLSYGKTKDGAYLGAVISEDSKKQILSQIEQLKNDYGAKIIYQKEIQTTGGHDIPPTLLEVGSKDKIKEVRNIEVFAPVSTVIKVSDEKEAEEVFNASDFALTGSIFSKDKSLVEHAIKYFRAGNFYVNRKCTGALVASEPFGGLVSKSSLSGTSAGSAHSLTAFYSDKTISGFKP